MRFLAYAGMVVLLLVAFSSSNRVRAEDNDVFIPVKASVLREMIDALIIQRGVQRAPREEIAKLHLYDRGLEDISFALQTNLDFNHETDKKVRPDQIDAITLSMFGVSGRDVIQYKLFGTRKPGLTTVFGKFACDWPELKVLAPCAR